MDWVSVSHNLSLDELPPLHALEGGEMGNATGKLPIPAVSCINCMIASRYDTCFFSSFCHLGGACSRSAL